MFENTLFALVRSTILAGLADLGPTFADVKVRQVFQPSTVGMPSAPQVTMQTVANRRYGWLRREERLNGDVFDHVETQWWETTIQIGATAHRNPQDPAFLSLPSAMDICKASADILQGDKGLNALAVQRVRPLRITNVRVVRFVNDSDQYESMPSFDLTLVYPQMQTSETPPVTTFEPDFGRV